MKLIYLDERPLGEFLVDLRFVHDVLGSAGVLQRAQSLLQGRRSNHNHQHLKRRSGKKKKYRNVISQSNITAVTTGRTSRLLEDGDTVAMMEVFVRPPSESCRILVSLDSLWEEIIQRMMISRM